jgi:hypothetical protein
MAGAGNLGAIPHSNTLHPCTAFVTCITDRPKQGGACETAAGFEFATRQPGTARSPAAVAAYTLPPDVLKKAKALPRIDFLFNLVSFYGLFILRLVLRWKFAAKYCEWAEELSSIRFLQACVFTPPLILTVANHQRRFTSISFRGPTDYPSRDGARWLGTMRRESLF